MNERISALVRESLDFVNTRIKKGIETNIDELRIQLTSLTEEINSMKYSASTVKPQQPQTAATYSFDDILMKVMLIIIFIVVIAFATIYIVRIFVKRNSQRFVIRRPHSETDTIHENIF
ncbi:CLUMA_CG006663, isoform A [Clunio marinus]|uniref:CLUMA_CG006663, isoform A n=1 Tax=Clunio marinus TaxID=568069 RepID=A0A1J1I251_9DIPT|nr:CLUMA_CG006663, isoform A [Clunio marinus]